MVKQQTNSQQIKNLPNKRSNNGTAVTESATMQSGWAAYTFTASGSSFSINVTFPTAFTNPPVVTAVYGGDQASGSPSLGGGAGSVNGTVFIRCASITTTGCMLTVWPWNSTNNATWATGNIVYLQWIAVGA